MKNYAAAVLFLVALPIFSQTTQGQTADIIGVPPYGPTHVAGVETFDRNDFRPPLIPREPQVITKGRLAVAPTDRAAFAPLLAEKNSGLIRLLAFELHQTLNRSKNSTQRRLFIVEGGPFFSFAGRTHSAGFASDIVLAHDKISVAIGGLNYGMLTKLGDIPLETINLNDSRLKSLAAFQPSRVQSVAQEAYTQTTSREGISLDGRVYRNQLPAEANSTYLLRSIVDQQSDVLVAFRLVRKENDGSVIIAWKLLKQYPTPKIKRTSTRFR